MTEIQRIRFLASLIYILINLKDENDSIVKQNNMR